MQALLIAGVVSMIAIESSGLELKSKDFKHNEKIPMKFTCDGDNSAPTLYWDGVPKNAKSLALICDDPDAPKKIWVHWVIFNIPLSITQLDATFGEKKEIGEIRQGINSNNKIGYDGPCPPSGTHHYHFTLYALDKKLDLKAGATKEQLLNAMKGHVVATAELIGLYSR
jgi:Raf kinase inhibitor-like YbhB/YbcL family protein